MADRVKDPEGIKQWACQRFGAHWWREGDRGVDFVVSDGARCTAVEVKSGHARGLGGLEAFHDRFPNSRSIIVGEGQVPLEEFLLGGVDLLG